jgi:proton-coupled amino acid transporter
MDTFMLIGSLTTCIYFIFVAVTFQEIINPAFYINWSIRTFILLTFIPVLLIAQIRKLKHLAPLSTIANFLILGAFIITIYYIFEEPLKFSGKPMVVSIDKWPTAVGTIIFAVTNIGNAISIENEMQEPQKYLGFFGVLNVTSYVLATFYSLIGFFSYLRYGDDIEGSVTLNLPMDEPLALTAKILIGFGVLLSFGLGFHICMEILWTRFHLKIKTMKRDFYEVSMRTAVTILMVALAILIPKLEVFPSFVGTIVFATLSIFVPVLCELVYLYDKNYGKFKWKLIVDLFLILLYFVILISGTCSDVQAIIKIYE